MGGLKKRVLFLIIILIIAVGAGYFIYYDLRESKTDSGSIEVENDGIEEATPAAAACALDSKDEDCEMPDLDKEFVVSADLPSSQRLKLMSDIKDTRAALKEDPDYLQNWLQLGLLYKAIEDYEAAEEAWQYATAIRPNDAVAFHNLGDLYHLYLPDFPKAETYYRKAIEINPLPFFYQKLYEFYVYSYKEKADLAEPLLREGIENNPGDELLPYLLEQHLENK